MLFHFSNVVPTKQKQAAREHYPDLFGDPDVVQGSWVVQTVNLIRQHRVLRCNSSALNDDDYFVIFKNMTPARNLN